MDLTLTLAGYVKKYAA